MTDDSAELLGKELDRLGPSEWAFDTLLKIAAFGFHDSHRRALRELTKAAQERHRNALNACPGCGHERHDPGAHAGDIRTCEACKTDRYGHCEAIRSDHGTVLFLN